MTDNEKRTEILEKHLKKTEGEDGINVLFAYHAAMEEYAASLSSLEGEKIKGRADETAEILEFGRWVAMVVGSKPNTDKAYYWNEDPSLTGWSMKDLHEHWKTLPKPPVRESDNK